MARAAVKRGLRLSVGSWNTIWMRLRSGSLANALAGMAPMSSPSKVMMPSVLSSSRITMVEVVDLPQPDSPTSPTLSPRPTLKLMPSTARKISGSGAGPRRNSLASLPPVLWRGNSLISFSTTSNGFPALPFVARRRRLHRQRLILREQVAQRGSRPRRRLHQLARIGMCRRPEYDPRLRVLNHAALLHHHDAIAVGGGQTEIVGDENGRHAALARQLGDEVHHRLLGGDIEAGGRLVGDQKLRPAGQRKRDDDALAHAAGQFERIGVVALTRPGDADLIENFHGLFGHLLRRRLDVLQQHVLDLTADLADRVERGARVLKDHRHFAAAQVAHGVLVRAAHVDAGEHHRAVGDPPCAIENAHHRVGGHRFTRTRLRRRCLRSRPWRP